MSIGRCSVHTLIYLQGPPKHPLSPPPCERRKHVTLAADRYKRGVHGEGTELDGRQIGQPSEPS
jgi:hypothetical protein